MNSAEQNKSPDYLLIKTITDDAKKQAEQIIADAVKDAELIIKKAKKQAEQIKAQAEKKADSEAELIKRRILSGVHLEIKQDLLREREKLINRVIDSVLEKLDKLRTSKTYADILESLIVEGAAALGTERILICSGEAEKKILTDTKLRQLEKRIFSDQKVKVKLELSGETEKEGGVLLTSPDRTRSFDNRFSARVKRILPDLRLEIVKKLEKEFGPVLMSQAKAGEL